MILLKYDMFVGSKDAERVENSYCISDNFMAFYNTRHVMVSEITGELTYRKQCMENQDDDSITSLETKLRTIIKCDTLDDLRKIDGFTIAILYLSGTEFD